jgi:hypothetical protein
MPEQVMITNRSDGACQQALVLVVRLLTIQKEMPKGVAILSLPPANRNGKGDEPVIASIMIVVFSLKCGLERHTFHHAGVSVTLMAGSLRAA